MADIILGLGSSIFMNIQLQRDIFYTFRTFRSIMGTSLGPLGPTHHVHEIARGRSYPNSSLRELNKCRHDGMSKANTRVHAR
jgi:hypothetical protein